LGTAAAARARGWLIGQKWIGWGCGTVRCLPRVRSPAMCAIYLKLGEELVEMVEQPYKAEEVLQRLLADYPNLLAGDQEDEPRRRWLLVQRELGIAGEEDGSDRWSLDHLFLDQDGVPTLVEVKRSSDTRLRREVVGQLLDYAANASAFWGLEKIRAAFETRHGDPIEAAASLAGLIGSDEDPERFWALVGVNLKAGKLRLIFVADEIPDELRRIVEFLNEQMNRTEVLALEVRQYVEQGGTRLTLVPRLIGETQAARQAKGTSVRRAKNRWEDADVLAAIRKKWEPDVARRMITLYGRGRATVVRNWEQSSRDDVARRALRSRGIQPDRRGVLLRLVLGRLHLRARQAFTGRVKLNLDPPIGAAGWRKRVGSRPWGDDRVGRRA
jgi:hypothetical protein